ncbi:MAG: hypothetical protein Kow006_05440 [Gammaproteobacteria bacterium]
MLNVVDRLPAGFLQAQARELVDILPGPTLIHLPGRRKSTLFVSILLHGNEDTGLLAMQWVLNKYLSPEGEGELPRALSLFVGNVQAAGEGLRRLDGQPDFNRVWPGTEAVDSREAALMRRVTEEMQRRELFASIDIHNNTGINPHYACVNRLDHRFFHLATLFSRTVVYFIRPTGVQSAAFAELCPAVTLECGKVGDRGGVEHAAQFVDACLHLAQLPEHPVAPQDIDLFHTVAIVRIPEHVRFGFGRGDVDVRLAPDLDHLNFRELPKGTTLGWVERDCAGCIEVRDEHGEPVAERYFEVVDGELRTRVPLMPSMFTRDERVIRQDCLGYLMERYPLERLAISGSADA